MIFTRLMTPLTMRRGTVAESMSTPSMRKRTRSSLAVGRQVHVRRALLDGLGDDPVDELDDRRVLGRVEQLDDLGAALLLLLEAGRLDDVVQAREARDERGDVLARGDRRAHLVAGHQRDVVDGEDVGRVGHRDEQAAVADELHRARPRSAWPPPTR